MSSLLAGLLPLLALAETETPHVTQQVGTKSAPSGHQVREMEGIA